MEKAGENKEQAKYLKVRERKTRENKEEKTKNILKRERWRSLELFANLPQFTNVGFSSGTEIRPKRAQADVCRKFLQGISSL